VPVPAHLGCGTAWNCASDLHWRVVTKLFVAQIEKHTIALCVTREALSATRFTLESIVNHVTLLMKIKMRGLLVYSMFPIRVHTLVYVSH